MNKLISYFVYFLATLLLFFPITDMLFAQTGMIPSYNSNEYGISRSFCFKMPNNHSYIYIQTGTLYSNTINNSGKVYTFNSDLNVWYSPLDGSVNSLWGSDMYGTYYCQPVSFFTFAENDTQKIIKFQMTPAASCPDGGAYYTINSGNNWNFTPFVCGGAYIPPYGGDYNPKNPEILLFGYYSFLNGKGIYRSSNSGDNWTQIYANDSLRYIQGPYIYENNYGFIYYSPFDSSFVYANAINNLKLSSNGGYSFINLPVKWMKNIVFCYQDSAIYGFNKNYIYRSFNKGFNWDSVYVNNDFLSFAVNPDSSHIFYAGDTNGVYRSTNKGLNWELYNNTFPINRHIIGLNKDIGTGDTFFAVTKKMVYKVYAPYVMDVNNVSGIIPTEYMLYQNYPNPFNPITKINFSIAKQGFVTLKVYDVFGREIKTLINEVKTAGNYSVNFNASGFASGIYFYKLQSGTFNDVKKMILIK